MVRRPPRSTRTDTLCPYTTLFRSEAGRLLTLQAAWMADNRKPNPLEASMAKAKAGRVGSDVTLSCVELCSSVGYSEAEQIGRDTSELQSLMRISYAVFCLKKKNTQNKQ